MKCVHCQKTATVHLATVVGGKRSTLDLCGPCANRLEAEDLGHPRVVDAISASRAAAQHTGRGPRPTCDGCEGAPILHVTEHRRGKRSEHHLCDACFMVRLSDPGERAYYEERARETAEMKDVVQFMAEAEAEFGPGPENAMARGQWLMDCLRRRREPPAV